MVGIDFRKRLTHPSPVLLHPEHIWVRKMLCKSMNYPSPPRPSSSACRVSVSAVPGCRTALPRPSRTCRRSSMYSMTPLIRGSNLRLPEPPAGRCPPDTRAFAQPPTPRAAGPIADGPRTLPNRDVQLYGLTGRLPLFTPFSRPSSRAPAALLLAAILHRRCRLRTDRPDTDRNTQPDAGRGRLRRLDFRWTRTRLRFCPTTLRRPPVQAVRHGGGQGRAARAVSKLPYRGTGMTCP